MALMIPKSNGNKAAASIEEKQELPAPPSIINLAVAITSEPAKDLAAVSKEPTSASQLDLVIESNLTALINKLESAVPDIRTEMITIHKALAKDPAQVTILSQAQQAAIFMGYSKLTGIELVAKAAAKRGSKTPVSLEMFE